MVWIINGVFRKTNLELHEREWVMILVAANFDMIDAIAVECFVARGFELRFTALG